MHGPQHETPSETREQTPLDILEGVPSGTVNVWLKTHRDEGNGTRQMCCIAVCYVHLPFEIETQITTTTTIVFLVEAGAETTNTFPNIQLVPPPNSMFLQTNVICLFVHSQI